MSKTKIVSIVIVVIVIGFGLSIANKSSESHPLTNAKKIKVGLITTLTGQYSSIGEANKNAIMMAKEQLHADNIELYIEDDGYDPKKAISAYKKLRDINKIDAVLVLGAPSIQSLKPLTDADGVPLLGLGVTLVYEKDTVFQLMPAGDSTFPKLGSVYGEKYKKIVVAHSPADLFALNAKGFTEGLQSDVQVTDVVVPPASDFQTVVSKIVQQRPDATTVFLPIDDALKFLKALRVLDPKGNIKIVCDFGTEIEPQKYADAIGKDRLEGCISANIRNTTKEEFKSGYKSAYGLDPAFTADFTYDALGIIQKLSKNIEPKDWVSALSSPDFSYEGMSGAIRFNDDGTRLDIEPVLRVYKDGKFVETEEWITNH